MFRCILRESQPVHAKQATKSTSLHCNYEVITTLQARMKTREKLHLFILFLFGPWKQNSMNIGSVWVTPPNLRTLQRLPQKPSENLRHPPATSGLIVGLSVHFCPHFLLGPQRVQCPWMAGCARHVSSGARSSGLRAAARHPRSSRSVR